MIPALLEFYSFMTVIPYENETGPGSSCFPRPFISSFRL